MPHKSLKRRDLCHPHSSTSEGTFSMYLCGMQVWRRGRTRSNWQCARRTPTTPAGASDQAVLTVLPANGSITHLSTLEGSGTFIQLNKRNNHLLDTLCYTLSYGSSYAVFLNMQSNPAVNWCDVETEAGTGLASGLMDSMNLHAGHQGEVHSAPSGCGAPKQNDQSL